jgi:hypothetical protein
MYDVCCKFEPYVKATPLREMMQNVKYLISVFHAYGHDYPCQERYHPKFVDITNGAGYSDGEWVERTWSWLSKLVPMLKYTKPSTRKLFLARHISEWNKQRIADLRKY